MGSGRPKALRRFDPRENILRLPDGLSLWAGFEAKQSKISVKRTGSVGLFEAVPPNAPPKTL